jgi:hypothetical protein
MYENLSSGYRVTRGQTKAHTGISWVQITGQSVRLYNHYGNERILKEVVVAQSRHCPNLSGEAEENHKIKRIIMPKHVTSLV